MTGPRTFLPQGSATIDDLARLDLRVGRIIEASIFPEARRPAYRLRLDLGPGGIRTSSAQLPGTYPDPSVLVGRLVVCVANLPPRRVAACTNRSPSMPSTLSTRRSLTNWASDASKSATENSFRHTLLCRQLGLARSTRNTCRTLSH